MKISGTTIKTPVELLIDIEPVDKAERTESGLMMIEFIANKRKLSCTWVYLTNAEIVTLYALVNTSTRVVSIEYQEPETGTTRTANFYTGAKGCGVDRISGDAVTGWDDVRFNCIEQ